MHAEQKATLAVTCVLGAAVLGSYVPIAKDQVTKRFDHWLGIPNGTRYMFYALQLLAAVGFVTFILHYCTNTTEYQQGLFSYGKAVVPSLVGVLLLSSIGWSIGTVQHMRNPSKATAALVSGSLIVTALCSLLLLAGQLETQDPAWYASLGLLLFCLVTVLGDGVGWNARFLLQQRQQPRA